MKGIKISKLKLILSLPIAIISLQLYFGVLVGYLTGRLSSGEKAGRPGFVKSLVFHFGNLRVHIHHWLYGLGILFLTLLYDFLPFPQFAFGFLGGLIVQGIIAYPDWYKVITKKRQQ